MTDRGNDLDDLARTDGARYALFWAPPADSVLGRLGARWLGRDAETGGALAQPAVAGFSADEVAAITAEPRRYGLHATLKPPFRLRWGCDGAALAQRIAAFAAARQPFRGPGLGLARLGRFIALTPTASEAAVAALADACVAEFDDVRAPPDPTEEARRRASGLTAAQESNLKRWGYPYVLTEFRFHVTLTGPLPSATAQRIMPALARLFAPAIAEPPEIGGIALFREPSLGAPFRLERRFPFGGATEISSADR